MGYTNQSNTIATPPQEIRKLQILQNRDFVIEAMRKYYQMVNAGSNAPGHFVQGAVISFFIDLEAGIKRQLKHSEYIALSKQIFSSEVEETILGFRNIENYLDQLNVTVVDTRKKINTLDVEEENESKGL